VSSFRGNVLVTGDVYTASGGIVANLYDPTPGSPDKPTLATIKVAKQVNVVAGAKLAGVKFDGGGLAKDTNGKNAAVIFNDRCEISDVEVTRAVGVGALFQGGDQSGGKFTPARIKSYRLNAHHNGTSGRMVRARGDNVAKGSGFLEVASHLWGNNHGGKKSDAANKATQTSDHLMVDPVVEDEADGGLWWDISCWNTIVLNPTIRHITASDPKQYFKGQGIRWELNAFGTYPSGVYGGSIGDVAGSAVAVDESGNIEIVGVSIGACVNALELRQLTRSDDPGDGGTDPAKWLNDSPASGRTRPAGRAEGYTGVVRLSRRLQRQHLGAEGRAAVPVGRRQRQGRPVTAHERHSAIDARDHDRRR
jgi:hypothetical protein